MPWFWLEEGALAWITTQTGARSLALLVQAQSQEEHQLMSNVADLTAAVTALKATVSGRLGDLAGAIDANSVAVSKLEADFAALKGSLPAAADVASLDAAVADVVATNATLDAALAGATTSITGETSGVAAADPPA